MNKENYIVERIKKIKRMMNDFIDQDLNIFQKIFVLVDLAFSIVIYGGGINDYFQYQFYKRRHIDRKNFIVHRKRMRIVRTCNDKNDRIIFDHKPKFNQLFDKYLGRDWLESESCSFDDFSEFAKKHKKFIIKPTDGSHGKGIRIESISEFSDLESLFKNLKKEKAIIEEIIQQHEELEEFNPTSVNTLRVVTLLCADGKARVMTANLRMGNGERFADNFHHNGIAALLDVDNGIVVTSGIDRNFKKYIIHPESGKQIIGFRIPYWDKVVETVKEAAQVVPTVRYVGWDVAIGKNGEIHLVEGNAAADPDVSQMPDQIGKWPLYKEHITAIKKLRKAN